jgi:hypothetical protein
MENVESKRQQTHRQPGASRWLDPILIAALFAAGLGVRCLYVSAVIFPPLDDPAFYLTTAENLVSGRGLEVDVLWSYQNPSLGLPHPSHEHWMPLPTGLMAAALALQRAFSDGVQPSLLAGQMPGLILGALLVPLTFVVGRRILPEHKHNRWLAAGAALLVATNATLSYQSASADSSAPFAFLTAWALTTAVRKHGDPGGYFGTGLLVALAYLTRSDGLLLLLAIPLAWWLLPSLSSIRATAMGSPHSAKPAKSWEFLHRPQKTDDGKLHETRLGFRAIANLLVAFCILVVPWLVRNYLAFGTPLPGSVLNQAWLRDYLDTFNYLTHPNWQDLVAQGWQAILTQRWQALLHNGNVFLLVTFPWGLLALPGLWLLRGRRAFYPPVVYGVLLFLVTAIVFSVSSVSGTFYHSLGAVVPFLALAAVYAVYRAVQHFSRAREQAHPIFAVIIVGLVALAGGQAGFAQPAIAERHQAEKEQFEAAAAWLAQHASPGDVVMTSQPYTLNYASGHPCIVLPGNESPEAAWEAAQRYGARFLVITQTFGRYPQVLNNPSDPRFRLLEATEALEIYEISLKQP